MKAPPDARAAFAAFLAPGCDERLFRHPTPHPASPTGFCFCDGGVLATLGVIARGTAFRAASMLPFSGLNRAVLGLGGVRIARGSYLSVDTWFDPLLPQLITVEEGVFIGSNARIYAHEFRVDEFRAGRTVLRRGCFIGAHSLIACGVEVGEGAVVAAGAVVGRDVPAGMLAVGNPARLVVRGSRE
jgi:acetyltransferase-like isoleucine patch superfamily enzyme